eukprot:TRINITY_DN31656_c0_g1_i1.p1 TRINITY_DN31656_c0_g1~~TRINITY_DN31656_c0_g1_i1.p1  ORF type:complete len:402 (+),score=112.53 TRINITY_DN31656_c0_g1_i1:28-1233(+)
MFVRPFARIAGRSQISHQICVSHQARLFAKKRIDEGPAQSSPAGLVEDTVAINTAKVTGSKRSVPAASRKAPAPPSPFSYNPRKEGLTDDALGALGPGRSPRLGVHDEQQVLSYYVGDSIDLARLETFFKAQNISVESWSAPPHSGSEVAIECVSRKLADADVFYFRGGSMSTWGLPTEERKRLQAELSPFVRNPRETIVREQFTFKTNNLPDEEGATTSIVLDEIMFGRDVSPDEARLQKLAFSYALHETVYLMSLEGKIKKFNNHIRDIPPEIAEGKFIFQHRRRSKAQKLLGEALSLRQSLNFSGLDSSAPDLFWNLPEVEQAYEQMSNNLNITDRVETANVQLDHGIETVQSYSSLNHETHGLFVEYSIVALIFMEVMGVHNAGPWLWGVLRTVAGY